MALLSSNIILSGILFLSPSNPAFIQKPSAQVWLSDPQAIEVQSLHNGVLLKAHRSGARLQALGLNAQKPHEWTRIHVSSDANIRALQKCPTAPIDWSHEQGPSFLKTTSLIQNFSLLQQCGFENLHLTDEVLSLKEFENLLIQKESEAEWKGARLLSKAWQKGQRVYRIEENRPELKQRLIQSLDLLAPFVLVKESAAPKPGHTLIFEVTLFEFSRHAASKLGVAWPQHLKLFSVDGDSFRSLNKGVGIGADFGESLGIGKILARPQIRVKAGQKARFQSGGEFPVTLISENVQKTEWKNYGLLLELAVPQDTTTGAREIVVDFKVEVSEPEMSLGSDSSPGLSVRRLESQFDLRTHETTVLSTMIQTRQGARRSGLRGLNQVPLLQDLFSQKGQQEQASELWFAIRPVWDEVPWSESTLQKGTHELSNL
jgi:hypothetical protein